MGQQSPNNPSVFDRPPPTMALQPSRAVALLRPIDSARRSAGLLGAMGYLAALAPVTQIMATGAPSPAGDFDAILAASARALTFLSAEDRARFALTRLFAVGAATVAAARGSGLEGPESHARDAVALKQMIVAHLPRGARVLYLAARDRKRDLETALEAAGSHVAVFELYRAEAVPAWSEGEARTVRDCSAALHYSRRSAALGIELASRAGIGRAFLGMRHVCLSSDVARPLRDAGACTIAVASEPRETALFAALRAETEHSDLA